MIGLCDIQPLQASRNVGSQSELAFARAGDNYVVLGCEAAKRGCRSLAASVAEVRGVRPW